MPCPQHAAHPHPSAAPRTSDVSSRNNRSSTKSSTKSNRRSSSTSSNRSSSRSSSSIALTCRTTDGISPPPIPARSVHDPLSSTTGAYSPAAAPARRIEERVRLKVVVEARRLRVRPMPSVPPCSSSLIVSRRVTSAIHTRTSAIHTRTQQQHEEGTLCVLACSSSPIGGVDSAAAAPPPSRPVPPRRSLACRGDSSVELTPALMGGLKD